MVFDRSIETVPRVGWLRVAREWRDLRRDPLRVLFNWRRTLGPVYRLPGHHRVFALSDPRDIQHVLATRMPNYHKGGNFELTRDTLGEGLVTSNGPHHDQQRRRLGSLFQLGKWGHLPTLVRAEAERATRSWTERGAVDVGNETSLIAIAVIGRALFGRNLADQSKDIAEAFLTYQRYLAAGAFSFWPSVNRWRRSAASRRAADIIVGIGEDILSSAEKGATGSGFLSALLSARDDLGRPLERKLIRDEIITFLGAGHETTGGAMAWTFDYLFRSPPAMDRLLEESRSSEEPTPYVEWCLLEAMRLRPPVWCLGRRAQESDRLPSGVVVPADTHVVIFPHTLTWDPAIFHDAESFRPERFSPASTDSPPPYTFMPFGAGPRSCLGEGFAILEMKTLLHFFVRRFDIKPVRTGATLAEALISLRPRGGVGAQIQARSDVLKPM